MYMCRISFVNRFLYLRIFYIGIAKKFSSRTHFCFYWINRISKKVDYHCEHFLLLQKFLIYWLLEMKACVEIVRRKRHAIIITYFSKFCKFYFDPAATKPCGNENPAHILSKIEIVGFSSLSWIICQPRR